MKKILLGTRKQYRMSWAKPCRRSGQALFEYTVLITAIAAVTFVGTAVFFQRVCRGNGGETSILKNYFNQAVERIR